MTTRNQERGSVLMVVLVILVALLAGGGVALYLQLGSTRQTGLVRFSRAALFCSEAGLQAARRLILCQYGQTNNWGSLLDPSSGTPPTWYADISADATLQGQLTDLGPIGPTGAPSHVIIGDDAGDSNGSPDWIAWVRDDDDEFTTANDPLTDNNLRVIVHSRCIMFPDQPREVLEVLRGNPNATQYEDKRKGQQGVSDQTDLGFSDPCL